MLDKGADVNLKNDWGNTAFTIASQDGHAQIAALLKDATAKANRLVMIVGTVKLLVILIILAIIIRIGDDRPLDQPFFEDQKWRLNDAYKILLPLLALTYLQFILHHTLNRYAPTMSLIFVLLYCAAIYGCYYLFIKNVYNVSNTVFGLDKAKFLKSGVFHTNIALILALLAIIFGPKLDVPSAPNRQINLIFIYSMAFLGIFVAPVLEELLFRGILYQPVARKIGALKAVGLLSLVGGLWHLHYSETDTLRVIIFFTLLYCIYIRSTSLYGPIIWHMTVNFMGMRSDVATSLRGFVEHQTLDEFYVCCLVIVLLTINALWLTAFLKRPHSERIPAKTIGNTTSRSNDECDKDLPGFMGRL